MKKRDSIQTDRMKLRHQDIVFSAEYQKGKANPTDFISQSERPFTGIPIE